MALAMGKLRSLFGLKTISSTNLRGRRSIHVSDVFRDLGQGFIHSFNDAAAIHVGEGQGNAHSYRVEWRLLRACDYGAPTTRRLFVVARRDKGPIVWPAPSHGNPKSAEVRAGKLLPWRTAAECIDWSIPSQSIFDRKKPLALATQRRIAEGLRRYVLQAAEAFIVTYYGAKKPDDFRGQDLGRPLPTQTTENRFGLISPVVVTNTTGHAPTPVDMPMPTLTTGNQQMMAGVVVAPILSRQFALAVPVSPGVTENVGVFCRLESRAGCRQRRNGVFRNPPGERAQPQRCGSHGKADGTGRRFIGAATIGRGLGFLRWGDCARRSVRQDMQRFENYPMDVRD